MCLYPPQEQELNVIQKFSPKQRPKNMFSGTSPFTKQMLAFMLRKQQTERYINI